MRCTKRLRRREEAVVEAAKDFPDRRFAIAGRDPGGSVEDLKRDAGKTSRSFRLYPAANFCGGTAGQRFTVSSPAGAIFCGAG